MHIIKTFMKSPPFAFEISFSPISIFFCCFLENPFSHVVANIIQYNFNIQKREKCNEYKESRNCVQTYRTHIHTHWLVLTVYNYFYAFGRFNKSILFNVHENGVKFTHIHIMATYLSRNCFNMEN